MEKEQSFDKQNSTEYKPTPAECKLLEVLLDPANRNKSKTEICSIAGIERGTYYNAFKKPEFKALIKKTALELTTEYILPVIHAFAKFAQTGSYQHGEALLEMADIYKKTTRQEHTGPDGGPIETITNDLSHLSDQELDVELAKLEAQNKGLKPHGDKPKTKSKPKSKRTVRKKVLARKRKTSKSRA